MPNELASPEMYHRVFVGHHEGASVLVDLVARFHDRSIHVAGGLEAQGHKIAAGNYLTNSYLRAGGSLVNGAIRLNGWQTASKKD